MATEERSKFRVPAIAVVVLCAAALWGYYVTRGQHDEFATLGGHHGAVFSMALAPDGNLMASGGSDGTIRVWDIAGQRSKVTLRGHKGSVLGLAWSPSGEFLVSCGADKSIRIWNVTAGIEKRAWRELPQAVHDVAISSDGKLLAGGVDKHIFVWRIDERQEPWVLSGHLRPISGLKFLPGKSELASFAGEGTVRIWELTNRMQVAQMKGPIGHCYGMLLSNDGNILGCVGGGRVHLYNLEKRLPLESVEPNAGILCGAAFSPDGRTLAIGTQDKTILIWDLTARKERSRLLGHDFAVAGMSFLPNGKTLVTSSHDGTLKLWGIK